jgi:hypothetical protein
MTFALDHCTGGAMWPPAHGSRPSGWRNAAGLAVPFRLARLEVAVESAAGPVVAGAYVSAARAVEPRPGPLVPVRELRPRRAPADGWFATEVPDTMRDARWSWSRCTRRQTLVQSVKPSLSTRSCAKPRPQPGAPTSSAATHRVRGTPKEWFGGQE